MVALLLAVLAGFPLGILVAYGGPRDIGLGVRWTPLIQAHGHLQVMGWLGLFLMGVAFQVVPRFKQAPLRLPLLARPAIVVIAAGLIARTVSQPYADGRLASGAMLSSAFVEALGVALFAALITATLLSARRKNYDWYLLAALGWLAAAAAANIAVVAGIAIDRQTVIPAAKNDPYIALPWNRSTVVSRRLFQRLVTTSVVMCANTPGTMKNPGTVMSSAVSDRV
jgi:hypothetical protein